MFDEPPRIVVNIDNVTIIYGAPQDGSLKAELDQIMATIADLTADVQAETTVNQSAITLLNGLASQLAAAIASGDPAALGALHDSIVANTAALSAAVTANTPAAPAA